MPKSKNRIELYHLGKEDAMTEFKHRHRKQWWPDSSQYKRGLFDGMLQLKNRGEPAQADKGLLGSSTLGSQALG